MKGFMNKSVVVKRITPGYANFVAMYPELNCWEDESQITQSKEDPRTLASAVAQRERRKQRNLRRPEWKTKTLTTSTQISEEKVSS